MKFSLMKTFNVMTKRKHLKFKKKKISVSRRFAKAISALRRMKAKNRRAAALSASNDFIRDISRFLIKIRKRPDLVKASHKKILKRNREKLRKLVYAKTPINMKRLILAQKGGFLSVLVPIIVAIISAAGGIGAAATSAAILKS